MQDIDPFDGFKNCIKLNFGEHSNDRLRYLRTIGSTSDTKIVVTEAGIIPGLMASQPEDMPERNRWKRYQFITIDEIRNDLKLQPKLLMKPQVRLVLWDMPSLLKHIGERHLAYWSDMLHERTGTDLYVLS